MNVDWTFLAVGVAGGLAFAIAWLLFTVVVTELLARFGKWLCDRAEIEEVER